MLWLAPFVPDKFPKDGVLYQSIVDTRNEKVVWDDDDQLRTKFLNV